MAVAVDRARTVVVRGRPGTGGAEEIRDFGRRLDRDLPPDDGGRRPPGLDTGRMPARLKCEGGVLTRPPLVDGDVARRIEPTVIDEHAGDIVGGRRGPIGQISLSEQHDRRVDEGAIPAYKMGRVLRVKESDLEAFIETTRVQPGSLAHLYPERVEGD